jgi:hypothetical protein
MLKRQIIINVFILILGFIFSAYLFYHGKKDDLDLHISFALMVVSSKVTLDILVNVYNLIKLRILAYKAHKKTINSL